jgi:hypothetical protein
MIFCAFSIVIMRVELLIGDSQAALANKPCGSGRPTHCSFHHHLPPSFAGPRGILLIGTFSVAAEPARRANAADYPCRADEAAGQAKTANDAKRPRCSTREVPPSFTGTPNVLRQVGSQSADTIKFYFREHSATSLALARNQTETRHVAGMCADHAHIRKK